MPELCNGETLLPKGLLQAQRAVQQDQLEHLRAQRFVIADLMPCQISAPTSGL